MATQKVDISVPAPLAFIDRDAARLEAKKTLMPGATDAHGTRIIQAVSLPSDYGMTTVTVEVLTA